MPTHFVCPRTDCGRLWSMEADDYGLFDGFGSPPCPACGKNGVEVSEYVEWECPRGHTWRENGNSGLVLGMVPRCPEHDTLPVDG